MNFFVFCLGVVKETSVCVNGFFVLPLHYGIVL